MSGRHVVWVSTSTETRGGVATYVRAVRTTPLWSRWSVRHVVTHADGSPTAKVLRFVRGLVDFWWLLLRRRPALVHVHTSAGGSFVRKAVVAWSARLAGVPYVLHVHAGGFADFHAGLGAAGRRVVTATLEGAGAVVALGPTWAGRLQQVAPRAAVTVVPNAVASTGAAPARAPRSARDPLTVLFLGRLGEEKGTWTLIGAWPRVLAALPAGSDVRLVLAGDGEVDRARRQADDLGLGGVEIPGWVSTEAVDRLLAQADVLVLPSLREGQPMAVLEAMARGVPVVATEVGGVPDLVGDAAGLLVAPDDADALVGALARVLGDPDLRVRLGEAGRARVRDHFTVEATWRALDALYAEILGAGAAPG